MIVQRARKTRIRKKLPPLLVRIVSADGTTRIHEIPDPRAAFCRNFKRLMRRCGQDAHAEPVEAEKGGGA